MLIRPAEPSDVATLVRFIHELAEYEQEPDAVAITEEQLRDRLFGDVPHLWAHVAEVDGQVVGMAIWFLNFSTWAGTHGVYLEDLYVTPQSRGRGAGKALLSTLADICVQRGYARLELWVLDWNRPAIEFYRSLGFVGMDEWTVQRLHGEPLRALADTDFPTMSDRGHTSTGE